MHTKMIILHAYINKIQKYAYVPKSKNDCFLCITIYPVQQLLSIKMGMAHGDF